MSAAAEDDIRADFLLEAGELTQRLSEQLVELEGRPADQGLLNAIFRAFHTVKGGAGFLALDALVDLCHAAEDVFNGLRAGKISMSPEMMDAVLQALDQVMAMLQQLGANQSLEPAPPALIATLRALARGERPAPKPAPAPEPASGTISDDEFEALLDQLHGKGKAPGLEQPEQPGLGTRDSGLGKDAAVEASSAGTPDAVKASGAAAAVPESRVPSPESRLQAESRVPSPESRLPAARPASPAAPETTVRVDTHRLDKMMNLVGELVLVRNRLKSLRPRGENDAVARSIRELDFVTRGLQNAVMQIRMQPIRKVFSRFPKLARDLARGLGKQVEVELVGEDTDLDKNLVEALADPLTHMVRNSIDHGLEMPDERVKRGKAAAGRLTLSAQQEGDHILITVRDDGAGMDPERLRSKAVQKGLIDAATAAQLPVEDCLQLVFLPGFSTKEQITDLSGRGVGMDVVQSSIKQLNGSVSIDSRLGHGTAIRIRVPLTLAILSALMVQADGRAFALPLAPVADVFALDDDRIRRMDRWDVVLTRRETLRLIYLEPWLSHEPVSGPRHVVVARVGDETFGFVVREVRGREEIVIKPLGPSLRGLAGVAGATVLPNGQVALILDFPGLVQAYKKSLGVAHG